MRNKKTKEEEKMTKYWLRRIVLSVCLAGFTAALYALISPPWDVASPIMWLFFGIFLGVAGTAFQIADSHWKDGDSYVLVFLVFGSSASFAFALIAWVVSWFN